MAVNGWREARIVKIDPIIERLKNCQDWSNYTKIIQTYFLMGTSSKLTKLAKTQSTHSSLPTPENSIFKKIIAGFVWKLASMFWGWIIVNTWSLSTRQNWFSVPFSKVMQLAAEDDVLTTETGGVDQSEAATRSNFHPCFSVTIHWLCLSQLLESSR